MAEAVTKFAVNDTLGKPNFKPLDKITRDDTYDCFYNVMNAMVTAYGDGDGAIKVIPMQGLAADEGAGSAKTVVFPSNTEEIRAYLFYNSPLENIVLPNYLKYIRESAFENCSKLQYVKIPESVLEIENNAFAGCTLLKNIYVNKRYNEIAGAPWGATDVTIHFYDTSEYYE